MAIQRFWIPKSAPSLYHLTFLSLIVDTVSDRPPSRRVGAGMEFLERTRPHCEALTEQIKGLVGRCMPEDDESEDGDEKLTEEEVLERQDKSPDGLSFQLSKGLTLRYAWLTQRGWYPDEPEKHNQDSYQCIPSLGGADDEILLAVFDGHGKYGTECATFARDNVEETLQGCRARYPDDFNQAYNAAFKQINGKMHADRSIDDSLSGTTAVSALIKGHTIYVANLGDSRIVLGEQQGGKLIASPLSIDQTPFRKDERERIKEAGGIVCSHEQLNGRVPMHDDWGDLDLGADIDTSGDPPRVWKSAKAQLPGCAFTRSLGDAIGEEVGVCAEAEVCARTATSARSCGRCAGGATRALGPQSTVAYPTRRHVLCAALHPRSHRSLRHLSLAPLAASAKAADAQGQGAYPRLRRRVGVHDQPGGRRHARHVRDSLAGLHGRGGRGLPALAAIRYPHGRHHGGRGVPRARRRGSRR